MMNLARNRVAAALVSLSLAGCGKPVDPVVPQRNTDDLTAAQKSQIEERGYAKIGEGVFLIPGRNGRSVGDQAKFAQAVANFRQDNTNLVIVREIHIDSDSAIGHRSERTDQIDGIILWTEPRPTVQK